MIVIFEVREQWPKMMSVQDFENHVKPIVFSFPADHEFEVGQILETLHFTYRINCGYGEVVEYWKK